MSQAKMYKTKMQKVRVSYAVEVDANMIKEYLNELGSTETVSQFIKSHMIASGIGSLEEHLWNNGYGCKGWLRCKLYSNVIVWD